MQPSTQAAKATIRKAEKADCARMLELIKELAEYEKALHEVTVSLQHFEESGFGKTPVWWAFVAEHNSRICGFALYYIRYSTWKGKRLYLEDFYVEPDKRKMGIGAMLFETLIEETKQQNYNGMVWQVLEWNTQAIEFYRKYNSKLDSEWINCSL